MRPFIHLCFLSGLFLLTSACQIEQHNPGKMDAPSARSQYQREAGGFQAPVRWIVDTTHSSVLFRTRHTANHNVVGWLRGYRIELEAQRFDFSDARIQATFDLHSLQMPNPEMAANVKSVNFLSADQFPRAAYVSKKVEYYSPNKFTIQGDLTLKEVTLPVDLDVTFNGFAHPDLHGLPGFEVHGKFSRFDFGIDQRDTLLPGGVPTVDDTIHIEGNFRLYAQPE